MAFTSSSPSPQAHVASVQSPRSTNWYPDSSASHHVANVSHNIQQVAPFEGSYQRTNGNGQCLNINAYGVISSHSPFNSKVPFTLKNLYLFLLLLKIFLMLVNSTSINKYSLSFIPHFVRSNLKFLNKCFFSDWLVMMPFTTFLPCFSLQGNLC